MFLALLIIGFLVVVASIATLIFGTVSTPKNLRGFYGLKYIIFTIIGVVAGAFMVIVGFLI